MRRIAKKIRLHRVSITVGDELFAEMLKHWDDRVSVVSRRGAKQVRTKITPESVRKIISERMARSFHGTDPERVIWPQHLRGSIIPSSTVEIVVEVNATVSEGDLNPSMIALLWEDIMRVHLATLPSGNMKIEVLIIRHKTSYGRFTTSRS